MRFRDVYMTLGLLRYAGQELEYAPKMFEEVASIYVPGTARNNMGVMLNEMVVRDPSSTSSKNFIETDCGIGYVQSGDSPYDRNGNLLSIAMKLARSIEEVDSNYRVVLFKIGLNTKPTFWLESHGLDFQAIQEGLNLSLIHI